MYKFYLSNVTPIDGGEIVVFCVVMAAVITEVAITVDVVKLSVLVEVLTGGDFIMLVLTSTAFGSVLIS